MKALAELGLQVNESIPLDILLGENFNGALYGMTQEETDKVHALREVVAEYNRQSACERNEVISDSRKAARVVYGMLKGLGHEEVWAAFLTKANTVISVEMIFKGAVDSVVISPRVILAKALSLNATGIILYHNHPSGSVLPSVNDIKVTNNLKKACGVMEVTLLDHIIIGGDTCYSFADELSFKVKK